MAQISVITTLHNYAKYIGDCINSFLRQKIDDSEMVIIDDASKDDPYSVLRKFPDKRIKVIKLDENKGYSHAKNVGIKYASAEILVMLDADDMLTKNSLKVRYDKLMMGYDFVHGPVLDLRHGKQKPSRLWDRWRKKRKYKYVHAQSVMLRKDIHRKIGLYDETLRSKSDREMWARIFHHGFKISFVKDFVSIYRIHSKQMHRSREKQKINKKLQKEVLRRIEQRKKDLSGLEMLS